MKVLLARTKVANISGFLGLVDSEPLELEYLYTVLKQENIDSMIYDGVFAKENFTKVLEEYKPHVVAITGYITQENLMIKYSKLVKSFDKSIVVILGGVHVELNYKRFFGSQADYLYHSTSIKPFIKLMNSIKNNLHDFEGVCYKNEKEWVVLPKVSITNANELPIPDRTFLNKHINRFRYIDMHPVALVKTAYSCPYKCGFCYCRQLNNGEYFTRDIEQVIEEIEGLDCENIFIVDDHFLFDKSRVLKFIEYIEEKNIKKNYVVYSRSDFIAENEDVVRMLYDIGVKYVMVGLEAVDDENLKKLNKQASEKHNTECVKVLQRCSIELVALMIVNIDAKPQDFDNIYNWIKDMNIRYVTVSLFTPMPGTDDYNKYKLIDEKIEHWDFLHLVAQPLNMSKRRFKFEFFKLNLKLFFHGVSRGGYKKFVGFAYIWSVAFRIIRNYRKD